MRTEVDNPAGKHKLINKNNGRHNERSPKTAICPALKMHAETTTMIRINQLARHLYV